MTSFTDSYIMPFVVMLGEMAPYLLLGFLIAGVMHAFMPKTVYQRYLGRNDNRSVLLSLLLGIPLPLCSCGVIPTAVGMRRDGASKGATTAFLIATPQTGIDSILATYSVLGLPFAILRPIVALVTGLFGGIATNLLASNDVEHLDETEEHCSDGCCSSQSVEPMTFFQKCREALDYGFTDMLMDIGKWLIVGLLLAGIITIFVPDNFFTTLQEHYLLNMLVVLLIACPMYVCATGSIPVAAALMLKGLSPGAALVFLMAGPATNMASMMVLGRTLGRKSLAVYLCSIIAGAIISGIIVDALLPAEWFNMISPNDFHAACCHEETPWWEAVSSIILILLLLRALALRFTGKECHCHDEETHHHDGCGCGCSDNQTHCNMKTYHIKGMMCNHCRSHAEEAIRAVPGVESASVDLASGNATVEGTATDEAIIAAVTKIGYECTLV